MKEVKQQQDNEPSDVERWGRKWHEIYHNEAKSVFALVSLLYPLSYFYSTKPRLGTRYVVIHSVCSLYL